MSNTCLLALILMLPAVTKIKKKLGHRTSIMDCWRPNADNSCIEDPCKLNQVKGRENFGFSAHCVDTIHVSILNTSCIGTISSAPATKEKSNPCHSHLPTKGACWSWSLALVLA